MKQHFSLLRKWRVNGSVWLGFLSIGVSLVFSIWSALQSSHGSTTALFALFVVLIAIAMVVVIVMECLAEIELRILSSVSEARIENPVKFAQRIKKLSKNSRIEAYVSDWFVERFRKELAVDLLGKPENIVVCAGRSKIRDLAVCWVSSAFPGQFLFFFEEPSRQTPTTAITVVGAQDEPGGLGQWITHTDPNVVEALYSEFVSNYSDHVPLHLALDKNWLVSHMNHGIEQFSRLWKQWRSLQIEALNAKSVYAEQLKLSKGCSNFQALDKTDLKEWQESQLSEVLEENQKSAANSENEVWRIFLSPPQASLTDDHRQTLANTLKANAQANVHCGLLFLDEIDDNWKFDIVLYDKKVIWLETEPTGDFAGRGIFSTDPSFVDGWKHKLQEIKQLSPKDPFEQAKIFVSSN